MTNLVIQDASDKQRRASDPHCSAWVMASAGSGKTKVLADRVLRLLLSGTAPNKILCLTFTRAAAAEMRNRINAKLEQWTIATEEALIKALTELENQPPTEAMLTRARNLFAHVLDAPGGMRIETIHGFCQSLLQRFPLEAGLSPHLQVMEEQETAALLATVRNDLLNDPAAAPPLGIVLSHQSGQGFHTLLDQIIKHRGRFERLLAHEHYAAELSQTLGIAAELTLETLLSDLCNSEDTSSLQRALAVLPEGKVKANKFVPVLAKWLSSPLEEKAAFISTYFKELTTKDKDTKKYKLKSLTTTQQNKDHPWLQEVLQREADRLIAYRQTRNKCILREATLALLDVAKIFLSRWQDCKQQRGCLDYDDLILHARALLTTRHAAAWVLYKLDGGLDHILLDEAQDTNPDQWAVVKALTDEFFAGEGRNETREPPVQRTVFAVGDIKQSIYSFQRADPQEFSRMRSHYAAQIAPLGELRQVPLQVSFRSVRTVLEVVDRVFADDQPARAGLLADQAIQHHASRSGDSGMVEVWPLLTKEDDDNAEILRLKLARQVATRIQAMIGTEILLAKDRPVHAGDILVLVRRRNNFVFDLVRELKERGVAVAGVDRMILNQQLVVKDLLALAQVLLLPEDDLTLATVLKGPLFRFGEEQLLTLTARRGRSSLWHSLKQHQAQDTAFAKAVEVLTDLLNRADQMSPFALFSYVLTTLGGRKKILAQLGPQALDPLEEFISQTLNFEQVTTPSLQNFVQVMAGDERELKREQEQAGHAVRIMTIHGAKGLQAPVVFLPDTTSLPPDKETLLWLGEDKANLLWLPLSNFQEDVCTQAKTARQEATMRESYRLLYVAMTRAEDRLIVCGYSYKKLPENSWYPLIRTAVEQHPEVQSQGDGRLILTCDQRDEVTPAPLAAPKPHLPPLPDWALIPPPPEETPPRPLTPSRLVEEEDEPVIRSPLDGDKDQNPFLRGLMIHTLMQILPDQAEKNRLRVARLHLARLAPQWSVARQQTVLEEVFAVLQHPDFAPLFAVGSQAEVPLAGRIGRHHVLAGQVDRLMVTDHEVLVVDYKTNRRPPADTAHIPQAYIRQMAAYRFALSHIYPDRTIRCALLWTDGPTLMPIPESMLEQATETLL